MMCFDILNAQRHDKLASVTLHTSETSLVHHDIRHYRITQGHIEEMVHILENIAFPIDSLSYGTARKVNTQSPT